ncbi:hypothetical protein P9112_007204 [Eukaryota sp. TZLM1-RC]
MEENFPSQDSVPLEGRSPSLVPYEEKDEVSENQPSPSQHKGSEVPFFPAPQRSLKVPFSFSTQRVNVVQPPLSSLRRTEVVFSPSKRLEQGPVRIPFPDSPVVPPSRASDTPPPVSELRYMALLFPPRTRISKLPSGIQPFKVRLDKSGTVPSVPSITPQRSSFSPSMAQENDIGKSPQRAYGCLSRPQLIPGNSASNNWKANPCRRPRDFRPIPSDSEAIPPTEMSKEAFHSDPVFGPYFPDECITESDTRHDPEPKFPRKLGIGSMLATREGVFRPFSGDDQNLIINIANPCPYPRFSPVNNASLDILIDQDYRTGWWYTETTYGERLFLYNGPPDHRRAGNFQDALQRLTIFPGCTKSRMLELVMVEGRIERYNLVQPFISESTVSAQFDESVLCSETQIVFQIQFQTESQNEPQVQPAGNQPRIEQAVDEIITVNIESIWCLK